MGLPACFLCSLPSVHIFRLQLPRSSFGSHLFSCPKLLHHSSHLLLPETLVSCRHPIVCLPCALSLSPLSAVLSFKAEITCCSGSHLYTGGMFTFKVAKPNHGSSGAHLVVCNPCGLEMRGGAAGTDGLSLSPQDCCVSYGGMWYLKGTVQS